MPNGTDPLHILPITEDELLLDLIETARDLYKRYNIKFIHVRAHRGNKYNEMADKLARKGFGL